MITEPVVLREATIMQCWKHACDLLIREGDRANLMLHIEDPNNFDEDVLRTYNPCKFKRGLRQSARDVANTIFPSPGPIHSRPVADFCTHYQAVYDRGLRRHPHTWGTYFQRLISFGTSHENQLTRILDAMVNWNIRPRAAFVFHLSSAALDSPRPQGAPCWQYGQFVRNDDSTLSFTAVYRSHDYFQKTLGNLAGLRRLLHFVCHHAGMKMGTLSCLSTFASTFGQGDALVKMLGV
jgi:hypothetical protein